MNKTLKETQRTQGFNYLTKKLFNHQSWSKVSFDNTLLSVNISNSNHINMFCVVVYIFDCAISYVFFTIALSLKLVSLITRVSSFKSEWHKWVSKWQTIRHNNNQIWLGQKETEGSSLPQATRRHIFLACRLRRNFRRNGQTFSRTWQRSQCNPMSSLLM